MQPDEARRARFDVPCGLILQLIGLATSPEKAFLQSGQIVDSASGHEQPGTSWSRGMREWDG